MKRYVKEFAHDEQIKLRKTLKDCNPQSKQIVSERIDKIDRVLSYCERGFITDFEAVSTVVKIASGE